MNDVLRLKPCPFCFDPNCILISTQKEAKVNCSSCAASGPVRRTRAEALQAWNLSQRNSGS